MFLIVFLYFTLISDVSPVYGFTHAVIGNYSHSTLNSKDCGITGLSPPADSSCFEWHSSFPTGLKGGQFAYKSEVPWMVLLKTELE